MTTKSEAVLNELVERIRAATFEAPKAGSHTEWARRITTMFTVVCTECGEAEDAHRDLGDFHESGNPYFAPLVCYTPLTDVFVCPVCGHESFGAADIEHGWCNHCRAFTRKCSIGLCPERPAVIAGNIAVCEPHGDELGLAVSGNIETSARRSERNVNL